MSVFGKAKRPPLWPEGDPDLPGPGAYLPKEEEPQPFRQSLTRQSLTRQSLTRHSLNMAANRKSVTASQEWQHLGQQGQRRRSEGGDGHGTNPADLSLHQSLPRRPSLDWPNLNNQKGFKSKNQEQGPPNLVLPDAANNMQTLEDTRQVFADHRAKLEARNTMDASAPRPLSVLKQQGSNHSSAASMHSAASGASASGQMPPLMPGRLNSQEINVEEEKDDIFFMPMPTPGGGPIASATSPIMPSRVRRIAAQSAAPAAQQGQDTHQGGSRLPKPSAGTPRAAQPSNVPSQNGQNRIMARNAPRGSSTGESGGAYTSLQLAANKALAQREPAGGNKMAQSKLARAREYAKSLTVRGAAAAARNQTRDQSMATSMAQSVASSHPGSGTVSPRHTSTYGAANSGVGYSASPRIPHHQPKTGMTVGNTTSAGGSSGGGRYAQRGYAQQQGAGSYAQRSMLQHGSSAAHGSPSSVNSGASGGYSATLQRGGAQSGYSGGSGYSGAQRLAPPSKVGGVVRPSGIGMGAGQRPGYGAPSSGPGGIVPGVTGSPRIGPTHARTTSASSVNSSSIPAAPRKDTLHQSSIPRLNIPAPPSTSHSHTNSFSTCADPSSATAAAAAVSAPAVVPLTAADENDAVSAPYADSAAATTDVPDHTPRGTSQAQTSGPDHQLFPQPQAQSAGAAADVAVEGVEGEVASMADLSAAPPPAVPTVSSASGSMTSRMRGGPSMIPTPPTTNQAGSGLGSGVGNVTSTPRQLQKSNTLSTRGGSVAGLQAHPDLLLAIKDRDWEIQGLQTELAKTAAVLESVYVDLENEAKDRADAQARAAELEAQLLRVQEQQTQLQEACTAAYAARDAAEAQQGELQDMCEEALGERDEAQRKVARMQASLEALVPSAHANGGSATGSSAEAHATGDVALQEELQRCIACLADAGAGDSPTSNSHLDVQGQLKQLRQSLQGALRPPPATAAAAATGVPAAASNREVGLPKDGAPEAATSNGEAGVPAAASNGEGRLPEDGGILENAQMEEHIKELEADKQRLSAELAAARAAAADAEAQHQQHALELQDMQRQLDKARAAVKGRLQENSQPAAEEGATQTERGPVSMVSTDAGSTPQQHQANRQTFVTAAVQTDHDEKPIGGPQEESAPEGAVFQRSLSTGTRGTQSDARAFQHTRSVSTLLPAERAKRLSAISLEPHPEQLAEWEDLVRRSSEAGNGISPKKRGVPHMAGQLRGALEDLHAHVQQQLHGLGGQDTRMAALLQQLGEQEAEQQMVLGAVHRELQAKIKQATAEASAMATNSPRKNQSSTSSVASWVASSAAPHAQHIAAADREDQAADHPAWDGHKDSTASTADAAATVVAAPREFTDKHAKEGEEAGTDRGLANCEDPGREARWDKEGSVAVEGDGQGEHGSERQQQQNEEDDKEGQIMSRVINLGVEGAGVKEPSIEVAGVDGEERRTVNEKNSTNDDGGAVTKPHVNGQRPPKQRHHMRNALISVGCTTVAGGATAALLLTNPEAAEAAAAAMRTYAGHTGRAVRTYADHTGRALARTGGQTRDALGRASNTISSGVHKRWSNMRNRQASSAEPTLPTSLPRPAGTKPWWDVR